ncbi:MAG: hypothetical protein RJB60_214 [Pseudomonadota bacterium]|jgi:hypothetical protein
MIRTVARPLLPLIPALLVACAMAPKIDNAALPEAVRVPAGQVQSGYTVTSGGEITYECRAKKDMADQFEWAFVGPVANLTDGSKTVGKYYAGPTWESMDGSKVTGKQVAVAPNMPGAIPLQLVKANPATGSGSMQGVSYIQRLNTKGGVAPSTPCTNLQSGMRQVVSYQADYVFYKPAM